MTDHTDLTQRLRGVYPIGPIQENGEPEFGHRQMDPERHFTPAIQFEAADFIEAQAARIAELEAAITRQARAAKTLRELTLAEVDHLTEMDRSEYIAAQTVDGERHANEILTEELDAAQSRIAELEAAQAWQPIETAPKDGTPIYAWRPAARIGSLNQRITAVWLGDRWWWPDEPTHDGWWNDPDGAECGWFISDEFTHWMPLPPAPQEGE